MTTNQHEIIQLELKYCERCGGLWLRRQGTDKIYCAACSAEMPEYSLGRFFKTRPRVPGSESQREARTRANVISIRSRGGVQ